LRTLGFNDRDLHFEVRQVEGASGLQGAARELIRAQPRVIWTSTDIVARIVRAESSDVPIVFGVAADPVQGGVVESWAKPGGNVTGVAVHGHVPGKRLEILKEMVPGLRRVLVMPDPTMEATTAWLAELREAARRLGLSLVEQPVASKADIERWPEIIKNERVDGIVHIVNATVNRYLEDTTKALGAARVPDISYYLPPQKTDGQWQRTPCLIARRGGCRPASWLAYCAGRSLKTFRLSQPTFSNSISIWVSQRNEECGFLTPCFSGPTRYSNDRRARFAKARSMVLSQRPSHRAAHQVRAGNQPQDRKALGLTIPPSLLQRRIR
jgi:hypothetical protein